MLFKQLDHLKEVVFSPVISLSVCQHDSSKIYEHLTKVIPGISAIM